MDGRGVENKLPPIFPNPLSPVQRKAGLGVEVLREELTPYLKDMGSLVKGDIEAPVLFKLLPSWTSGPWGWQGREAVLSKKWV